MSELENIHKEFTFIKAAFESGKVRKMSDLEKEKPTLIAKLLGINQGRYGAKLFTPEDFSLSEIIRLSIVINVDVGVLVNIIKNGLADNETKRIEANYIKSKRKVIASKK